MKNKREKEIDIESYDDFIKAGFKECKLCGWTFAPEYFDGHECKKYIEGKSDDLLKKLPA